MSIVENYHKLMRGAAQAISSDLTFLQKMYIYVDFHVEAKLHGVQLIDYLQYNFYWKRKVERRKFICYGQFMEIVKKCNKKEFFLFFDNKPLFNEKFSEYIGRKWIDSTKCTYEQFCDFTSSINVFFAKPIDGMCGRGARIIEIKENTDLRECYDGLKAERCILEEIVHQHQSIAEFNESSVNTLRLITFVCADGEVKVMGAIFRMGRKGKVADNFHYHGIVAIVDVDTGIICTTGVDRDFKRYVVHPDSLKPIVGFIIPFWSEVLETVKKAAKVVPEVRYVGWDIAVGEDGQIIMIEGNKTPDQDVMQVPDQVGKWPIYKRLLAELD